MRSPRMCGHWAIKHRKSDYPADCSNSRAACQNVGLIDAGRVRIVPRICRAKEPRDVEVRCRPSPCRGAALLDG